MVQLYIANKNYSSWSLRPWLLMTELNIAFEEVLRPFIGESNPLAFKAFSPTAKVPCLHDGDTVVWDSLAIVEYLAEQHQGVWPADKQARAWARSAAAEMHSGFDGLRNNCTMNVGIRVKLFNQSDKLQQDIKRIEDLWREGIEKFGGPFLAGATFTAVDAFYAPVVFRFQTFGIELSATSAAYCQHMLSLEGMKNWQQQALLELWRDPDHEDDIGDFGEITRDDRAS